MFGHRFGERDASDGSLAFSDSLSGSLTRETDEASGSYEIQQGNLAIVDGNNGNNYALTFVPSTLTIQSWWMLVGFRQPVGIPNSVAMNNGAPLPGNHTVWNVVRGGSTVPLRFSVFAGSTEITDTVEIASIMLYQLSHSSSNGQKNEISEEYLTSGNTTLSYIGGDFSLNWKTPRAARDSRYRFTVTTADGSTLTAFFTMR